MASERRTVRRHSAIFAATRALQLTALLALSLSSFGAFEVHAQKSGGKPARAKLTVSGSSLLAPLMNDVSRRFEAQHQGIAIDIRQVGSARAVAEVRTGASDIAMLSRGALDSERNLFLFPIARDGVAVIVHRTNPLKSVTNRQLIDILTGRLTNWKSLGGRDAPVHLGWRSSGQGSIELILDHLDLKREQIEDFIDYALSAQVVDLQRKYGFVPYQD